jgi:hypothetical protein
MKGDPSRVAVRLQLIAVVLQLIVRLCTNIVFAEHWINIIPFLLDIVRLEDRRSEEADDSERADNQPPPQPLHASQHHALTLINRISRSIVQPDQLDLLLDKDTRLMSYLKWSLRRDMGTPETVMGLQVLVHFQSITPSVTSRVSMGLAGEWLTRRLQELKSSENEEISSLSTLLL